MRWKEGKVPLVYPCCQVIIFSSLVLITLLSPFGPSLAYSFFSFQFGMNTNMQEVMNDTVYDKIPQNRKFDDLAKWLCVFFSLSLGCITCGHLVYVYPKIRDKTNSVCAYIRFQSMRDTFRTYLNLFGDSKHFVNHRSTSVCVEKHDSSEARTISRVLISAFRGTLIEADAKLTTKHQLCV